MKQLIRCILFVFVLPICIHGQGSLFIIGGGDRPEAMMQRMISEARLSPADHIGVLTMSSANPDTSFHYFKEDIKRLTSTEIVKLHFTTSTNNDNTLLEKLRTAKLIFITGGVQTRFMNVVLNTPIYDAIHTAYKRGAMIAGTSAGAAVMSEIMITGDQIRADTIYEGSFDRIIKGNVETKKGLGFLQNTIIDQHFVVRSRYNRLLTVVAEYPAKTGIGIDEATALFIRKNKAEVIGESQVIVFKAPKSIASTRKVRIGSLRMHIFTHGDSFKIKG